MRVSCQQRQRIDRLIAKGERLDPLDLEDLNGWLQTAYKELECRPHVQQRFDRYCRSSCDATSMRVFVGIWILKLSLWTDASAHKDLYPPKARRLATSQRIR